MGSWAGPSQQQSKMEKKILLLDLSHYGFTFLSMEEQIGLMSRAQLQTMQQGGKRDQLFRRDFQSHTRGSSPELIHLN